MKSLLFTLLASIFSFIMNSQNMVSVSSMEIKITTVKIVDYTAKENTSSSPKITKKIHQMVLREWLHQLK